MNPIEVYKRCVERANKETKERFGVDGPFEPKTPEHDFWLQRFDMAFSADAK